MAIIQKAGETRTFSQLPHIFKGGSESGKTSSISISKTGWQQTQNDTNGYDFSHSGGLGNFYKTGTIQNLKASFNIVAFSL